MTVVEYLKLRAGYAGLPHNFPGKALADFQLSGGLRRAKGRDTHSRQPVNYPRGQRLLRADYRQVNVKGLGGGHYPVNILRVDRQVNGDLSGAGIAAGDPEAGNLRAAAEPPSQGVFPPAGADQ